jgi:cytoskeletal protein CcmA (bactofilin family)
MALTLDGTLGISTTGNITGNNIVGNLTSTNINTPGNVSAGGNIVATGFISVQGNVTGNYIIGNGSQLTGLPAGYANSNVVAYANSGWAGNIIPSTANTYTLGNATNTWQEVYVGPTSLYIGGNALSAVNGVLAFNGANIVTTTASTGNISVTGNVTAGNVLIAGLISAGGNIYGTNISVTGNVVLQNRLNWGQNGNSVVYQIYNAGTGSLDTIFG